jgi:hypothetical protein
MVESDQIFQKRKKIMSHVKVAANRVLSSYFIVCGCQLSSCDLTVGSYCATFSEPKPVQFLRTFFTRRAQRAATIGINHFKDRLVAQKM